MKHKISIIALLIGVMMERASFACGGPSVYTLAAPVTSIEDRLSEIIIVPSSTEDGDAADPSYYSYYGNTIPQVLFLYPFHLENPKQVADLWKVTYRYNSLIFKTEEEESEPRPVSTDSWEAALKLADLQRAEGEARAIVEHVLDMPVAQANQNQRAFGRAVEFLELKSLLAGLDGAALSSLFSEVPGPESDGDSAAGPWSVVPKALEEMRLTTELPTALREALTLRRMNRKDAEVAARLHPNSPRMATLRFIALQETLKRDIPNGWKEEIKKQMTADSWKRLEGLHDAWLKDYPDHPLADLVRLSKVRLYYFQDDRDRAWKTLLGVYPRHLPRVLAEARYLVRKELMPRNLAEPKIDPILISAILPSATMTPQEWSGFWQVSESNLSKRWGVNFQERLLAKAIEMTGPGKPLPSNFPPEPLNPTPLWGKLRVVALLKAGQWDLAKEGVEGLKPDADVAVLKAKVDLHFRNWEKAVLEDGLTREARLYLIRALLPDDALSKLSAAPDKTVQREASLTLAVRSAMKGDWARGATLLQPIDPARARLWQVSADLAKNESLDGLLVWARYLREHAGKLFFPSDTVWYRSIFHRLVELMPNDYGYDVKRGPPPVDPGLPWSLEEEVTAIRNHLTASESYLALQAQAAWLKASGARDKRVAGVLREADENYNRLINLANNYSNFWKDFLKNSAAAETVRSVGKRIRSQ